MNQNFSQPNNKNSKKTFYNKLASAFSYFGIIGMFVIVILMGIGGGVLFAYIDTAGELSPEQLKVKDSTSVLYDIAGKPVESIYGSENREWVDIDKIPLRLQQAFISIEDERFYQHNGIDLKRIAGAGLSYIGNLGHAQYGASTITQQLIKNLTGDTQSSLKRKIQEQWRAVQLEKVLTKQQILELYLNIVPLGNGTNGVQSAAKYYYGKDISELDTAECAAIAGITKSPVYYDPFNNPDNNKKREDNILYQMKKLGYINNSEYDEAVNKKLNFKRTTVEHFSDHTYFTDQVINDVSSDLQNQKGYSKAIAEKLIYGGGLKIYTTMDSNIQRAMDDVYTNSKNFVKTNTTLQPQSAMVILDPKTGQVRGIVGGIGQKKGQRTLDRATQSYRQPGSTIKPIAVYAPAIEEGKITPNTIVSDSPITINGWSPHNYENSYSGNVAIKTAVARSINVVAVKVLQMVGIDDSYTFLKRLGISTLQPQDKNYASLALGGLTKGVSPLQMAAAYAAFDNGGTYIKPYTYLKVVDSEGNIILENTSAEVRAVMSERTAQTVTSLLQGVTSSGTGTSARLSKMPTAGKTGTASEMRDKWFVGYTPYYVGAVWYGYDQPQDLPSSTWNMSLSLWKNVMEKVHANLPYKDFDASKSVKSTTKPKTNVNTNTSNNSNNSSTTNSSNTNNSQTNSNGTNSNNNSTTNNTPSSSTNSNDSTNADNNSNSTNNSSIDIKIPSIEEIGTQ